MNTKNVLLIENCVLDSILIESLQQNRELFNINLLEDGFNAELHIESALQDKNNETPNLIMINGVNILSQISQLNNFHIPVIKLIS